MSATLIILADYRIRQQRLMKPLTAEHHTAALMHVACVYSLLPLHIASVAIAAYAQAQRDVLRILD